VCKVRWKVEEFHARIKTTNWRWILPMS
jgi:hypothetical protein